MQHRLHSNPLLVRLFHKIKARLQAYMYFTLLLRRQYHAVGMNVFVAVALETRSWNIQLQLERAAVMDR